MKQNRGRRISDFRAALIAACRDFAAFNFIPLMFAVIIWSAAAARDEYGNYSGGQAGRPDGT